MDLHVSRRCSSCGKPIEFGTGPLSLCSECQARGTGLPPPGEHRQPGFDPDRPPWNLTVAIVVLLFFMLLMYFVPAFALGIWAQLKGVNITPESLKSILSDPQATLVGVVATFGVHLLTLVITWTVVTGWERRFTAVVGWSWHPRFRFPQALATVALLYGCTFLLEFFLPSAETDFDKLLATSQAVRVAIACLAIITAPLVEELVYRGIIYPAVEVRFGRAVAVFVAGGLFALVHFPQYWESLLILVSLTILSFVLTGVRAYTGKLLPCYVIHLFYNAVGVTLIFVDRASVH